jgi:[ribosomal protein S5]-alanine N-acetyltransferase
MSDDRGSLPPASGFLLETERLGVRRIGPEDVDDLHAVYGDADGMRWVGDGRPLGRAECEEWVRITARNYETRGYGMYALVDRTAGEVAGFAGLVHPDGQPEAELKYALRRSSWGRGLATEAAAGLLRYAREELGIARVIATVAPEHAASQRVLTKAGMLLEGTRTNPDGRESLVFATEVR